MSVNTINYNPSRMPLPHMAQYKIDSRQPMGQKESFVLSIATGISMIGPYPAGFNPVDFQDPYMIINAKDPYTQSQIESVLTKAPGLKFDKYI